MLGKDFHFYFGAISMCTWCLLIIKHNFSCAPTFLSYFPSPSVIFMLYPSVYNYVGKL